MFKVISIEESAVTREVELLNLDTASLELCFDDSQLKGFNNFGFIHQNGIYDCKIYLFGNINSEGTTFKYVNDLTIGCKALSEVINSNGDVYYIDKIPSNSCDVEGNLKYTYSRKDIISVVSTIHHDFL
ncbi:MAG: hypothetical protein ACRCTA_02875 [Bacilli bacterium]